MSGVAPSVTIRWVPKVYQAALAHTREHSDAERRRAAAGAPRRAEAKLATGARLATGTTPSPRAPHSAAARGGERGASRAPMAALQCASAPPLRRPCRPRSRLRGARRCTRMSTSQELQDCPPPQRVALAVEYSGGAFAGFEAKRGAAVRTVQGAMTAAARACGLVEADGEVAGSSRTDAGVHSARNGALRARGLAVGKRCKRCTFSDSLAQVLGFRSRNRSRVRLYAYESRIIPRMCRRMTSYPNLLVPGVVPVSASTPPGMLAWPRVLGRVSPAAFMGLCL